MPYTPTTYTTGGNATAASLNNGETQYSEATSSLERDLLTPFVLSGFTAAKDGTTATQLDVAAGVAFPLQTDSTLRRRSAVALTYSTVGNASATMYLDLNPDGSWSWGTAHSAVSGYLTIATVTTDASANIVTVTDTRVLNTTLLSGLAGVVRLTQLSSDGGALTSDGAGNLTASSLTASSANIAGGATVGSLNMPQPNPGIEIGSTTVNNTPHIDFHSVAYANDYDTRIIASGGANSTNGQGNLDIYGAALHVHSAAQVDGALTLGGSLSGVASLSLSGNISGVAGSGIPTTRNGSALSVPIYTGTTAPTNPPTGAVWVKA